MSRLLPDRFGWEEAFQTSFLLSVLAFALYLPTLEYSFFADDHIYLGLKNKFLLELPWWDLWRFLTRPANPWEFLPVRDFTYWLDNSLSSPLGDFFHAGNLLWYGLCGWAAYGALRATLTLTGEVNDMQARALAGLGTLVFLIHPAHVEAVAWISGRKDILAAMFLFVAWMCACRSISDGKAVWRHSALVGGLLLLACFSKSIATVSGLLLVLLMAATVRRQSIPSAGGNALLVILICGAALWVHMIFGAALNIRVLNDPGFLAMLERGSRILSKLLLLAFWPFDLRLIHDVYALGAWHWLVSGLTVLATAYVLWRLIWQRQLTLVSFGWLWVVVPLIPYLQFMPFSTWSMASERFVFQSILGVAMMFCGLLASLRPAQCVGICIALGLVWGEAAWQRIGEWRSEAELWKKDAALAPYYFNSVRQLVQATLAKGHFEEASRLIARVERADARQMLKYLQDVKRLERQSESHGRYTNAPSVSDSKEFCTAAMGLLTTATRELNKIQYEKDLVYSNFVRSIKWSLSPDGRLEKHCADKI